VEDLERSEYEDAAVRADVGVGLHPAHCHSLNEGCYTQENIARLGSQWQANDSGHSKVWQQQCRSQRSSNASVNMN
jgi:hypothetical protein